MRNELNLHITNFDGPLDLLLHLIKEKKVNIFDIDLYDLTTQYVEFIKNIDSKYLDQASEYLVMASTLLQLKSRMILRPDDDEEEIEEDKLKLLKRLAEYQRFKDLSNHLKMNENERGKIFLKPQNDLKNFVISDNPAQLNGHSDPMKLLIAIRKMIDRRGGFNFSESTIETFNISPEERADELRILLEKNNELGFNDIFKVPTLKHFLVTILAILDMARKQEIQIIQEIEYGELRIRVK